MACLWLRRLGKYGAQQLLYVSETHTLSYYILCLSLAEGQQSCTTEVGITFDKTACQNPAPSCCFTLQRSTPVNPVINQTYPPNKSNRTVNMLSLFLFDLLFHHLCVCAKCYDVF